MTVHTSNLGRWLAPLALLACVLAVFVILKGAGSSSDSGSAGTASPASSTAAHTASSSASSAKKKKKRAKTYRVKPGDTLSGIAQKTGVALADLQAYNPDLDSQSLQTGQKVKLGP